MVALPAATPVTTPVALTVAFAVAELLQVPPAVPELDNAIVAPVQTLAAPVIDPADGITLTVTILVAVALPQPLLTL